jgi:6-pyruvoyl-tetrahydropterin synthase
MKYIRYILVLCCLVATLSSCEDWLSEVPFDKIPADELYATEQGAQEALNGLYLGMGDRDIYGGELTFGVVEALAQHYYTPMDHRYVNMATYTFGANNSKSYIAAIWNKLYKLITDCNVFLEQIEINRDRYNVAHYNLFKGEAIALRTYLHFDLFRLFAPAYTEENKMQRAIPYYDKEVIAPTDYMTVEGIAVQLLKDVDEAIALLAADPILDGDEISRGEGFWDYRNFRLNIYAAWILKARIDLHVGDKPGAYAIVSSLLEGKMPHDGAPANFMSLFPSSMFAIDQRFRDAVPYVEVIFGMHDVDRINVHKNYFSVDLVDDAILLAGATRFSALFNNVDDIRRNYFNDDPTHGGTYAFKSISKYQDGQLYSVIDRYPYRFETIPLIKKSEVYLIAAETSDNDADKARWLNLLRIERGYLSDNTDAYVGILDQLVQEEYDREFYAEGQYLYFLKRNGKTSVSLQVGGSTAINLVFPVPNDETNNRQ